MQEMTITLDGDTKVLPGDTLILKDGQTVLVDMLNVTRNFSGRFPKHVCSHHELEP